MIWRLGCVCVCLVVGCGWMYGCGTDADGVVGVGITNTITTSDPVMLLKIVEDTTAEEETRREADRRFLLTNPPNDSKRLGMLERLLFTAGQSDGMRIYGMDELVKADRERAKRSLAFYFGQLQGEAVVVHACDVAVGLKDPKLTGSLMKSLAREDLKGDLRSMPEAKGIEKLSGMSLEAATAGAFADGKLDSATRMAALKVNRRVTSDNEAKAMVLARKDVPAGDGLLQNVRWCVETWDSLPGNVTEVEWCGVLREAGNATLVGLARKRHAAFAVFPDYEFALRYVYLLAMVDEASAKLTREELIAGLSGDLENAKHVKRVPMYKKATDDKEDSLQANTQFVNRCDLLLMRVLVKALRENRITPPPMTLGQADREDTGSEHGGLMRLGDDGRVVLVPYKPTVTGTDYAYIGSQELVKSLVTGLGHYHFHFQDAFNEKIAGPGVGDLVFVKAQRCSGVVITAVNGDSFNMDFYNPDGAVVDLGVYR